MLKNKDERTSFLRNEKNWEVEYFKSSSITTISKRKTGILSSLNSFMLIRHTIVTIHQIQSCYSISHHIRIMNISEI